MNASRRGPVLALTLVAFVAACASEPDEPASWSVGDSAGIRIVENLRPLWTADDAWHVADWPRVEIGVDEGEEPYELFRVYDAHGPPDGGLVIANSGTGELRFYDPQGRYLYSAGRRGQGPGEFHELSATRLCSSPRGALVATDDGNARVNLFRLDGEFIGSVRIEAVPGGSPPSIIDAFQDDTWLAARERTLFGLGDREIIQDTLEYFRYNANGRPAENLVAVPDAPRSVHDFGGSRSFPYIPLSTGKFVVAGGLWLFVGDGGTDHVERRRLDGTLNSIFRWPGGDRRRTDAVYERYKREALDAMADDQWRQRHSHFLQQDLALPEYVPIHESLFVDDLGYLWVENYRLPWEAQPRWEVFDPDGRWLGRIETPVGLRIFQIGDDFLLGRHRDDLGVERVRLYDLIKPSG